MNNTDEMKYFVFYLGDTSRLFPDYVITNSMKNGMQVVEDKIDELTVSKSSTFFTKILPDKIRYNLRLDDGTYEWEVHEVKKNNSYVIFHLRDDKGKHFFKVSSYDSKELAKKDFDKMVKSAIDYDNMEYSLLEEDKVILSGSNSYKDIRII